MELDTVSILIGVLACVVFVAALTNPLNPHDEPDDAESGRNHWLQ